MVELVGPGGAGFEPLPDLPLGGQGGGGGYTRALIPVTPGTTYAVLVGQGWISIPGAAGVPPGVPVSAFELGSTALAVADFGSGGLDGSGGAGATADTTGSPLFASTGLAGADGSGTNANGVALVPNGQQYGAGGAGSETIGVAGGNGGNGAVLLTW